MEPDNKNTQNPQERYATPEIDDKSIQWDTDEAPTEWVPTQFEKRVKAIPEDKWNLYQTIGGAAMGLIVAALLFVGNGVGPGFLIGAVLAMLVPNWLENKGRRKLLRARVVMIAVLLVAVVAMTIYIGTTQGWQIFTKKETAAWVGAFRR